MATTIPPHTSNPYSVLGLKPGASKAAIKSAYHHLARKWHPDKNPGNSDAEKMFLQIQSAYEILTAQSLAHNGGSNSERYTGAEHRQKQYEGHYQRYRQDYHQNRARRTYQVSISLNEMILFALIVWLLIKFIARRSESYKDCDSNAHCASPEKHDTKADAAEPSGSLTPRESSLAQLAKTISPSVYELKKEYLLARGRRIVIFFARESSERWNCDTLEQYRRMNLVAKEFQRDPITFCWMDIALADAKTRDFWKDQFEQFCDSIATPRKRPERDRISSY
ncbi:hypothetical protein ABG067_001364 [Albugo candida]